MDVLVLWDDGTKNVVASTDLKTVKCKQIKVGNKVRMRWNKKWYYGTVLDKENVVGANSESSSDDDVVLSKIAEEIKKKKMKFKDWNKFLKMLRIPGKH